MSKSLCHDCIHNCTDYKNNICARHKGIWCNAEYGRVIKWIALWIVGIVYGNLSNDGFYIFTALCLIGSTIS